MKYRYLLIDNDNTLMDFHAAEHAALREALTEAGIEPTPPKTSARPALPCVTATISARTLTSCPARRRFCAACTGR